jgi:hypothetical protein
MNNLNGKIANQFLKILQYFYQLALVYDRKFLAQPLVPSCATTKPSGKPALSSEIERANIGIVELEDCLVDLKSGLHYYDRSNPILESSSWPESHLAQSRNPLPLFATHIEEPVDTKLMVIPSTGYYHWLLEDIPPIIHALRAEKEFKLVCFEKAPNYVRHFAKLFNLELIESPRFVKLSKTLLVVPRPVTGMPSAINISLLEEISKLVSGKVEPSKKIYISRENSRRSPLFEKKLVSELVKHNWKILYLENLDLIEQIRYFKNAEVVAGVHGAGLAGIVWSSSNTKVFEICPEDRDIECFLEITRIKRQEIVRIMVNSCDVEVPNKIVEFLEISKC